MGYINGYRCAPTIPTERLLLTPLRVEDADEMIRVLDDERLHEFVGGHPAALDALRSRYRRLVTGPSEATQIWLNWIVRERPDGNAVGTVQATINEDPHVAAVVAWVIAVPWQGRGFATEAGRALVAWLRHEGVDRVSANIHPEHQASARVASRLGFEPTDVECDGETVWRLSTKKAR